MDAIRKTRLSRFLAAVAVVLACFVVTIGDGTAGIQGSGFNFAASSYGPINRFGSVFVNGVEYDTSAAQIYVDGVPASESQLRVGQLVTVKAKVNEAGTAGIASAVFFTSDVVGPLAQVDLQGGTLVVLGQRIRLLGDTLFGENLPLGGILGLVPGIRLQISGYPNAYGEIMATRIDLVPGASNDARIKGYVQGLNTTARTFRVNSQVVDYSDAAVAGTLANGDMVSVLGTLPLGQRSLHATQISPVVGIGGAEGERGHVEGLITTFASAADFTLGTQRVATDDSTVFVLHGQTLGPNLEVDVRGVFNAAGVLVASKVQTVSNGVLGVLGAVEAVTGNTLRVLGVDFVVSDATAFDDGSSQNVRQFGPTDLRVGDYVEIRGGTPAPGGMLEAALVKRNDPQNAAYVEGKALQLLLPNLSVLGVNVLTTPQTRFPGGGLLASLKFILEGPNRIVRVRGTQSGNTLVAERIEYASAR